MKKNRILLLTILLLAGLAGSLIAMRGSGEKRPRNFAAKVTVPTQVEKTETARVPAYQSAEESRRLGPTLDPAQFFGKAREAYQIARKIPATLAQLPCYCHCDQSFGHKSLYTCFEDDHASQCAVCVDEALLAYQLVREEKLTPQQVRDKVIEKYSTAHGHGH
jgi:hypothetical protein